MKENETIFDQLGPKLKDYLISKGIEIDNKGFFKCICHHDEEPSMCLSGKEQYKNQVAHCFGCNASINILHAVHILEKKPITGLGLYEDTLPYLAEKYNLEYKVVQFTDKERDEYQKRSGVQDAASVIHSMSYQKGELCKEHPAIKHLLDRGINEDSIKKFGIGCITTYEEYIKSMDLLGYTSEEWLKSADLANKGIFNPECLIIPIRDDKDHPVGFVARTTKIDPNGKGERKYNNSLSSDIYHKSEILFNFNNYDSCAGPLWIVEGYLDAVYLDQCGLKNVVAIGATAFTEQHVDLLARYNIKNIIIALDADEGGDAGVKLAIERLSDYQAFKSIRIVELPKDDDPDTYTRREGIDKLKELASPDVALSPFAWTIKHSSFQDDPIAIVENAIPAIVAEESTIKRLKMVKELSKITGISKENIQKDVDLKFNRESDRFMEELTEINRYTQTALGKRKVKDTKSIIDEANVKIRNLEKKFNNTLDNRTSYSDKRENLWNKIESGEYKYGLFAPKFREYEKLFDGIPYTTCLTLVGGKPSAGKTALLNSLSVNLVEENPDLAVFFMSIDDTTELMTLKILAEKTGFSTSKIKQYVKLSPEDKEKINKAWAWLDKLSERFIMSDAAEGTNIETLESHLEWFFKEFPDKKKLLFLDNFHKLTMSPSKNKVDAVSAMSEKLKELTRLYNTHIIMTVELRKMDHESRPYPSDLKDTVQLEYDADAIILVHNDLLVKENTNVAWHAPYGDEPDRAMPFLEAFVWKNKITGKTGGLAYRLNTYNLQITERQYSEVMTLRSQNAGHQKITGGGQWHG